jgi:hypothetical protein
MSLSQEDVKKKISELEEIEPTEKKKKYKGYKKGFTRKYSKYK